MVRKQHKSEWTRVKRERFLAELAQTANVLASCRAVGMTPNGLRGRLKRDAAFQQACDAALSEAYAALEAVLFDRAMNGEEKALIRDGAVVDKIKVYPNSLAMRLLQAHRERVERARAAEAVESIEVVRERIERKLAMLMTKYRDIP